MAVREAVAPQSIWWKNTRAPSDSARALAYRSIAAPMSMACTSATGNSCAYGTDDAPAEQPMSRNRRGAKPGRFASSQRIAAKPLLSSPPMPWPMEYRLPPAS